MQPALGRGWEAGKAPNALHAAQFLPACCGVPGKERAQLMLATLTDRGEFWGPWLLPTLPYDDPKQEYWSILGSTVDR